jgi:hypothetical protein
MTEGFWQVTDSRVDELSQRLYYGQFSSEQEYWDMCSEMQYLSLQDSYRVWICYQMSYYVANKAAFEGRFPYGLADGINALSMYAMVPTSWDRTVRVSQFSVGGTLFENQWNPVGSRGFTDGCASNIVENCTDPTWTASPTGGDPLQVLLTWSLGDLRTEVSPGGESLVTVPTSALEYDSGGKTWVTTGEMAKSTCKYTLRAGMEWHDGTPLTLLDFIYADAFMTDWGTQDSDYDYRWDSALAAKWSPGFSDAHGTVYSFDDNSMATFRDFSFPLDPNVTATTISPALYPRSADHSQGVVWTVLEALSLMITDGSESGTAYAFGNLPGYAEVDVLVPAIVADIRAKLVWMRDNKWVPPYLAAWLGSAWVTPDNISGYYQNAINFIDMHGHAYISNGGFVIDFFDPANRQMTLVANRDADYPFSPGLWLDATAATTARIDEIVIPLAVQAGQDTTIVVKTSEAVYPSMDFWPGTESTVQLAVVTPSGEQWYPCNRRASGEYTFWIPGSSTQGLASGAYTIVAVATPPNGVPAFLGAMLLLQGVWGPTPQPQPILRPTIKCPRDVTVNAGGWPGNCPCDVNGYPSDLLGLPTTTGNVTSVSSNAPGAYPFGTSTVIWTAIGGNGEAVSCTQRVTVVDREPPRIYAEREVILPTAPGEDHAHSSALPLPTVEDNCGNASSCGNCGVTSVTSNAPATLGVNTSAVVTWTAVDVQGNPATAAQMVTVVDREPPTFDCPETQTLVASAGTCSADATLLTLPDVYDNCGVSRDSLRNNALPFLPVGSPTVEWRVADIYGNVATKSQTVVVQEAPASSGVVEADDYLLVTLERVVLPNDGDYRFGVSVTGMDKSGTLGLQWPLILTLLPYPQSEYVELRKTQDGTSAILSGLGLPIYMCPWDGAADELDFDFVAAKDNSGPKWLTTFLGAVDGVLNEFLPEFTRQLVMLPETFYNTLSRDTADATIAKKVDELAKQAWDGIQNVVPSKPIAALFIGELNRALMASFPAYAQYTADVTRLVKGFAPPTWVSLTSRIVAGIYNYATKEDVVSSKGILSYRAEAGVLVQTEVPTKGNDWGGLDVPATPLTFATSDKCFFVGFRRLSVGSDAPVRLSVAVTKVEVIDARDSSKPTPAGEVYITSRAVSGLPFAGGGTKQDQGIRATVSSVTLNKPCSCWQGFPTAAATWPGNWTDTPESTQMDSGKTYTLAPPFVVFDGRVNAFLYLEIEANEDDRDDIPLFTYEDETDWLGTLSELWTYDELAKWKREGLAPIIEYELSPYVHITLEFSVS